MCRSLCIRKHNITNLKKQNKTKQNQPQKKKKTNKQKKTKKKKKKKPRCLDLHFQHNACTETSTVEIWE